MLCEIRKNVRIQSCSFQKNQKFHFVDKICETQKKRLDGKLFA